MLLDAEPLAGLSSRVSTTCKIVKFECLSILLTSVAFLYSGMYCIYMYFVNYELRESLCVKLLCQREKQRSIGVSPFILEIKLIRRNKGLKMLLIILHVGIYIFLLYFILFIYTIHLFVCLFL